MEPQLNAHQERRALSWIVVVQAVARLLILLKRLHSPSQLQLRFPVQVEETKHLSRHPQLAMNLLNLLLLWLDLPGPLPLLLTGALPLLVDQAFHTSTVS